MAIQQQTNNLAEVLSSSDLPILVVFEATWCGPSHLMDAILEQINHRMQQKLRIIKIDSENEANLANQYQVHALPVLLLFKNGQVVDRIEAERMESFISADKLIQRWQSYIN